MQLVSLCQIMFNQVITTAFSYKHFAESTLVTEFAWRFGDFEVQKNNFELFCNPFAADVETAAVHIQMELIEPQCNGTLKATYNTVGLVQFPRFTPETMPQLHLPTT